MTTEPSRDCPLCPRLAQFRQEWRGREAAWHNAPVPSFGDEQARLLIVGLAPGLRGANATGRPFTGDYAGDLLYRTLLDFGFASGEYRAQRDDGLSLVDCRITNAVRCVPPQNKPEPAEIARCRPFLEATISAMPCLTIVLALGQIAHQSVVRTFNVPVARHPFKHGGMVEIGGYTLASSYHCSRYNTNTGVLTEAMFREVFAGIRERLG
ncbi:MAG: uracil-DNA glycosylase [Rhabdaerophilum sp.]